MSRRGPAPGFTLLELTVAVAVFAVLSLMAYGGLRTVLDAQQQAAKVGARLAALQMTVRLVEADLAQLVPRGVRDAFGDPEPALAARGAGLLLTRGGWRNPLGRPRSALLRVEYRLEDTRLLRAAWPVLDRVQASTPHREVLLDDVEALGLRFLGADGQWLEGWPPPSGEGAGALPRAVELTLRLGDWGIIRRLVPVAA
jgi:general secretion pathway protein J